MLTRKLTAAQRPPWLTALTVATALALLPLGTAQAAKAKIAISQAAWFPKTHQLLVKGTNKSAAQAVELFDVNGRRLASASGAKFNFALNADALPAAPCAVRVQAGTDEAMLAVKGAPKACLQAPICSIAAPAEGAKLKAGEETHFQATASTKDKKALPLTYEWDFAGGAMGEAIPGSNPPAFKRPTELMAMVSFVRNNSSYRVRFAATDAKGRRCEDAVTVSVGTPPSGLPGKVSEPAAAKLGSELAGDKGDVVVLPFEEWTFQNLSDMGMVPNGYGSFSPTVNNVRAYAFRKDRLPVFLSNADVELRYSAASNPADPVGPGSINSTSRNFPVAASLKDALVKKTDMWEIPNRPDSQKRQDDPATERDESYFACSWAMTGYWGAYGCGDAQGRPVADEGYFKAKKDEVGKVVSDDPNTERDHGSFMPGKDNPYQSNNPQPFSRFVASQKARGTGAPDRPAAWFEANFLPYTDTDDQGRVNPYSLLRVEAVDKKTNAVVAKTDGVVSASRDFHCRECHAKGGVAANPKAGYTKNAFGSSAWGQWALFAADNTNFGYAPRYSIPKDKIPERPDLFEVSDFGGNPNSLFDQEYAAALNYSSMHQYIDASNFLHDMLYSVERIYLTPEEKANPKDIVKDTPRPCYGCHSTPIQAEPFQTAWWDYESFKINDPIYAPNYSITMHRWHAEMQWNADKTDILRDERGAHKRWDWTDKGKGAHNSTKTGSLFPIFDASGKQLPMEENCLKCHAGHREQQYRDRMYTAGVTCFDCHGDMMAVGSAYPKNYLANKDKVGSTNRDDYRVAWFDEPDCGSCHVGDGNRGKDKANGFFSAGVMQRAFEDGDLSATPRPVDRNDPDARRFSAAPLQTFKANIPTDFTYELVKANDDWKTKNVDTKVDAALFREGKDRHGNVACAACHGAAHSVWPNRDPSANDNVTALQLQGHTGTILECNVCHSKDSFAKLEDLDGGANYSGDAKAGILGGPHDMHPVNDPYWWKQADGDVSNTDGTKYGGWHNNYAKLGGKDNEDQCAACHGADHKGTRLSKTPVDRTFDFSGLDFSKLKKAGFKSKVVTVSAGTPIGCDTCHSLNLSFTGSPGK